MNNERNYLGKFSEFDRLVKLKRDMSNPSFRSLLDAFNIFGSASLRSKYKPLFDLPMDQYYYVCSAVTAIDTFGNGEVGMEIYNNNKTAFIVSRYLEKSLSNISNRERKRI